MKALLVVTFLTIVVLCNSGEYGSADLYEFLVPARVKYDFHAGVRLPRPPMIFFKEAEIPPSVPVQTNLQIPLVSPIFSVPSKGPHVVKDY